MSQKSLILHELVDSTGGVCALGALGKNHNIDMSLVNPEDSEYVAELFNIAGCLAQETVYMNDECYDYATPEQRWEKMRAWAVSNIKPDNKGNQTNNEQ